MNVRTKIKRVGRWIATQTSITRGHERAASTSQVWLPCTAGLVVAFFGPSWECHGRASCRPNMMTVKIFEMVIASPQGDGFGCGSRLELGDRVWVDGMLYV